MKVFYKTPRITATGGRSGQVGIQGESLTFNLAAPEKNANAMNPEKLFAMGYASCFDNSLAHLAQRLELEVTSKTSVEVGLATSPEGGFLLDVDVYVEVCGITEEQAQELVETTDKVCAYSNAIRGNVDVRLHTAVMCSYA